MSYKHLSIVEREKILFHLAQGVSLCQIAKLAETTVSICQVRRKHFTDADARNVVRIKSLKMPNYSRW